MRDERTFTRESRSLNARNAAPVVIPLVLLLAVVLYVVLRTPGRDAAQSGRAISSYGFDLSTCLVPRNLLTGTDAGKGGTPALNHPPTMRGVDWKGGEKLAGIFRLVSTDRVIGVILNGEARAYPLWVMEAHEVCNDTLGGQEIAVTYNPLCDSAVVFDRTVDGQTIQFGVSGLLFNSNLLMYDRRESGEGESLWSQLQFRAVTGPAASRGATLQVLPCALLSWEKWRELHPETTVILPDEQRRKGYRPNAFGRYFADAKLRYDVEPLAPTDRWPLKTPLAAMRDEGGWRIMPAAEFGTGAGAGDRPVVFAFWFAWYAMHPEAVALQRDGE